MSEQVPSIGRIVYYRLSADDAAQINRRRTTSGSISDRLKTKVDATNNGQPILAWPAGAQAHIGSEVGEGQTFPMLIVGVADIYGVSVVNGQVFLDGNDILWVTRRPVGNQPGTFSWPRRV